MKTEQFEIILSERLQAIEKILGYKAKEYSHDNDRLYNFKVAARMLNISNAEALWGMAAKHLVSVNDLVTGRLGQTSEMINEKIGDMINYLILLEAILKEEK